MKPVLTVAFADFWPGFDPSNNLFVTLLSQHFTVVLEGNPEILFYSLFGREYLRYHCPKIFYTGERTRPDFSRCDYALSFEYDLHGGRNYRFPVYAYEHDPQLLVKNFDPERELAAKTKFCNFVYSNPRCIHRNRFVRKLSNYKRVECGGRVYNNSDGLVVDKFELLSQCKFTIAFENSSQIDYTTEKIVEPMIARSIPVYWGNPGIDREFNSESFVNWHAFKSDSAVIERIRYLDNHPQAYCEMLAQPWLQDNTVPQSLTREALANHLAEIISQCRHGKPAVEAKAPSMVITLENIPYRLRKRLRGNGLLRWCKTRWEQFFEWICLTI